MDRLTAAGVRPDVRSYTLLLRLTSAAADLPAARRVLLAMRAAGIQLDAGVGAMVLTVLLRQAGRYLHAEDTLHRSGVWQGNGNMDGTRLQVLTALRSDVARDATDWVNTWAAMNLPPLTPTATYLLLQIYIATGHLRQAVDLVMAQHDGGPGAWTRARRLDRALRALEWTDAARALQVRAAMVT
jgi:hypothetical protein